DEHGAAGRRSGPARALPAPAPPWHGDGPPARSSLATMAHATATCGSAAMAARAVFRTKRAATRARETGSGDALIAAQWPVPAAAIPEFMGCSRASLGRLGREARCPP